MVKKRKSEIVYKVALNRLTVIEENAIVFSSLEEWNIFLVKYIKCEAICNAYLDEYVKYQKQRGKELKKRLDMRIIPSAFNTFNCQIERHILYTVFGKEQKKGKKTCKKVRDGIVHSLDATSLNELHERYDVLIKQMDLFLSRFK